MISTRGVRALLMATTAMGVMLAGPANAADQKMMDMIKSMQSQIEALKKQVDEVQTQAKPASKSADSSAKESSGGKEVLPGVKVKLGGFIETGAVYRDKNQTTDMNSNFNTSIPFKNSTNSEQSEFRGSARQTRLSLLAEGDVDQDMKLTGYLEGDLMGAGVTSNSVNSNSYMPRMRQAFVAVDRNDWGLHLIAGQTFSLLAMNKSGMARKENGLSVIDAQNVPGYMRIRNPQVSLVKDVIDKKMWVGIAADSPQASLTGVPTSDATATAASGIDYTNPGVSPMNTGANYSSDVAPDVTVKVAFEPGWGHYEVYGLMRFFHDSLVASRHNNYAATFAGGVHASLPVVKDMLTLRGSFAAGESIGRYGAASMPDIAFASNGDIDPLTGYSFLVGANFTPDPTWDIYAYFGREWVERVNSSSASYGYGSRAVNNSLCYNVGGTCSAMTSSVWQVTGGVWKQLYKGNYGQLKLGVQDSLTRRDTFSDSNNVDPHAYENVVMGSFRYFPFD